MALKSWFAVVAFVFAAMSLAFVVGCLKHVNTLYDGAGAFDWHSVSVTCTTQPDGVLQFQLNSRAINSISRLLILSETQSEPLWVLRLGMLDASEPIRITYGLLPNRKPRDKRRAEQLFPSEGFPRKVAPNERFFVIVSYQYDTAIPPAACAGHREFAFRREGDGSVKALGIVTDSSESERIKEITMKLHKPALDHAH